MAFDPSMDDKPPPRPLAHEVGADLSSLSVAELDERIDLLGREIERLREARARKEASRVAAGAFFKV